MPKKSQNMRIKYDIKIPKYAKICQICSKFLTNKPKFSNDLTFYDKIFENFRQKCINFPKNLDIKFLEKFFKNFENFHEKNAKNFQKIRKFFPKFLKI